MSQRPSDAHDLPEELTLSELEQHLWGAANILRGPIDQADFKSYVFPLLFFKRICDVYDAGGTPATPLSSHAGGSSSE
jgi:hypothetical protein